MSDEEMGAGDIIAPVLQLVPGAAQQNKLKGWGYETCRHQRTELNTEARTVECQSCGKALDAFSVLLEYAHGERRWQQWQQEQRAAAARVAQLKEEEKKVKARTKAASRKDATEAVRAEQVRTEKMRLDTIQAARDVAALARRIEQMNTRKVGK